MTGHDATAAVEMLACPAWLRDAVPNLELPATERRDLSRSKPFQNVPVHDSLSNAVRESLHGPDVR